MVGPDLLLELVELVLLEVDDLLVVFRGRLVLHDLRIFGSEDLQEVAVVEI